MRLRKTTLLIFVATCFVCGSCKNTQTFTSTPKPISNDWTYLPPLPGQSEGTFIPPSEDYPGVSHPGLQPANELPLPLPPPNTSVPSSVVPSLPPPASSGDYDCRANLRVRRLTKTPFNGNNFGSPTYQEIMEYAFNNPLFRHFANFNPREPTVDAHETMHGYGSYGRGYFRPYDSDAFHFLYLGNGEGIELSRSKTRKQDVIQYVPARMRQLYSVLDSSQSPENFSSNYYGHYIVTQMNNGQPHHAQAGHLFEEWNCYIQDNKVGAEVFKGGGRRETGSNFTATYFALAAAYATSKVDPAYFNRNDPSNRHQFKAAFACLAEQAMANFHNSPFKSDFAWKQNGYAYDHLKNNAESKHLKDFLYTWFGSAWVSRVFRF